MGIKFKCQVKTTVLDKDDRKIILRSLFSRSDPGMSKDDSSPAMSYISNWTRRSATHLPFRRS
ncbi:DUF6161 domain-containing protein [Sphingobacterium kitahiroshimense]|uniref:DUF6161 domain-containing protein n=1 Tax=Sphingobacterium kitahiroshimense TaxID=470446 RepID=UPI003D363677